MWDSSGLWEVCEWPFRLQSTVEKPCDLIAYEHVCLLENM